MDYDLLNFQFEQNNRDRYDVIRSNVSIGQIVNNVLGDYLSNKNQRLSKILPFVILR